MCLELVHTSLLYLCIQNLCIQNVFSLCIQNSRAYNMHNRSFAVRTYFVIMMRQWIFQTSFQWFLLNRVKINLYVIYININVEALREGPTVSNQSEKCYYNINLVWINNIQNFTFNIVKRSGVSHLCLTFVTSPPNSTS